MNEMFIKRKIVKRGNIKIKLTPGEIREAAKIYAKSADIITKLNNWIDTIKICRNILDTVASFKIEFDGEYEKDYYEDTENEWCEYYKTTYSLKNGLSLCIESGDWDRNGNMVTHSGVDISLRFKRESSKYNENEVYIFVESELKDFEKDMNILIEKLKSLDNANE